MKRFSAQYIFTNTDAPLKRGIITTDDEGRILNIESTGGTLKEQHSVEFYDGIIIPGFVNCHCHLELSDMAGLIPRGNGLAKFITGIRSGRDKSISEVKSSAIRADSKMAGEGIVLCADICNTPVTFDLKKESSIVYKNLLEVFGLDPKKANKRIEEINTVAKIAEENGLYYSIVPHSTYSLSLPLYKMVRDLGENNEITSIHFMESPGEKEFQEKGSGELFDTYLASGIISSAPETSGSLANVILNEVTASGNLLLVHNTYADRETLRAVNKRVNSFWCLCPSSNIYISGQLPPAGLMQEEGCTIVVGTDSLASNSMLSILQEIRLLQDRFPFLATEELIRWATWNGARALNELDSFGSIETGKKPGLLLLQNIDLVNMKILPETTVKRLI